MVKRINIKSVFKQSLILPVNKKPHYCPKCGAKRLSLEIKIDTLSNFKFDDITGELNNPYVQRKYICRNCKFWYAHPIIPINKRTIKKIEGMFCG